MKYILGTELLCGGDIIGFTDQGTVARTALCFMIRSIKSKYRDVISMYPLDTLKAETLERCYNEVMFQIHKIGFNVVAIIVDMLVASISSLILRTKSKTCIIIFN